MEKKIEIVQTLIKSTKTNLKLVAKLVESGANLQHIHHQLMNQEAELAAYQRQIEAHAKMAENAPAKAPAGS